MPEPLWERIQRLIDQLNESLDEAPRSVREERDLSDRIRRELQRYEEHRAELSPPDRERLLDFVVEDLVGLARAYHPTAPAGAPDADDPARALRLLMEAGDVLAGSLEYEAMLDRLARLSVGWFSEVCAVYLQESGGRVRRVAAVHRHPSQQARLTEIGSISSGLDHPDHPVAVALRSGETLHIPEVTPHFLRDPADDEGDGPEGGAPHAVLVVPLSVRARVTGALVFSRASAVGPYAAAEVELAEELARRAALAVEDARVRDEAERARRARTEFVSSISHEFRTPLMTVVAFAHLLQEGIPVPIPHEARGHVARILAAAGHLDRLVEQSLGYQRAEAGWETVRPATTDLAAIARESAALVEPLARQKGLGFVVDAGDAPFAAHTDADKVRQILFSLLGNAVKFTDRGEIRLALRAEGDRAVLEVSDTGIGVAPENLERIFEAFWQAEPGAVERGPGIGLGLSLLRRNTWMLGGDVRVTSEPGRGSTFRVSIPLG
ncbi:MAG TPA: HAMP domain-containing sensor histidine kinase [Longimicrobium sp.]|jgi:signal transduction histidine kinase